MVKFQAVLNNICKKIAYISMAVVFILMCITTADVVLRKVSTLSVLGSAEMTEMGMVMLIFFAVAFLQTKKGHVRVDMLVNKFPPKVAYLVDGIVLAIGTVLIALMSCAGFIQMMKQFTTGTTTMVLHMPLFPFYLCMGIGLVLFAVTLATDSIVSFMKAGGYQEPALEN